VQLLQEQGLKQLTLRNLADRLSLKAPSLFWYISNKEELLALVDVAIFRDCIDSIGPCSSWQEWLRRYGKALWDAQCLAPDIPQLITQVTLEQDVRQSLYQLLHDQLAGFGIDIAQAMHMQSSVQALVTGWTVLTVRPVDAIPEGQSLTFQGGLEDALDALISGWEVRLQQASAAAQ
jgi:TetR/AcrR family tetracycline transcriptional repressor